MGIARDSWTGETDITPEEWMDVYAYLRAQIDAGAYDIAVRLPQRFLSPEVFDERPSYLGFCPVKLAERIEVHQNGQIHSCALNNGTPICLARFAEVDGGVSIGWEEATNELDAFPFDMTADHPCAAFRKEVDAGLVPLCISLKPQQDEYAWNKHQLDGKLYS